MNERDEMPKDLAAKVLYAADRTCCICRNPQRKVQIHHIDRNPANNDFDNLAMVCLDCHSDAHTTYAFARNLYPNLIGLYNESWREIVTERLSPHGKERLSPHGSTGTLREYEQEVLLEVSFACGIWLNMYYSLYPSLWPYPTDRQFADVWELVIEADRHPYAESEWERCLPLFTQAVDDTCERLERLVMLYSNVLPVDVKLLMLRTARTLQGQRIVYIRLPEFAKKTPDMEPFFEHRFRQAGVALAQLARLANPKRKAVIKP